MKNYIRSVNSFGAAVLLACTPPLFAQSWSGLGGGLDGFPGNCFGNVEALAVLGGNLYGGGDFLADGTRGIARWDTPTTSWKSVGGGFPGGETVTALTVLTGDLFAGGTFFTTAGGTTVNRIAKWNGTSWAPLIANGGTTPGVNDTVYALAVRGSKVYVGGKFTTAGDLGADGALRVAYWDTSDSTWHAMGSEIADGIVYAIAITGDGAIYAGGSFSGVLKKWNQTASTWDPVAGGPIGTSPTVYALTTRGNDLYVGGKFTSVGASIAVRGLAKLSGSTWSRVGSGTEPWVEASALVRAITWNGGNQMYVTGTLVNSNAEPPSQIQHIFAFVNGVWSPSIPSTPTLFRAGCPGDYGRALAVDRFGGKVYVGGYFDTAGGFASPNVATWNDMEYYTIADIGTLSGGSYSYGLGVNNSWAVGYAQVNVSGYGLRNHAYYYQGGYYINDMGGIWGAADNSYANAINDSGMIVGYSDYYGSGSLFRAFKWTMAGGFVQLNPFTGGDRGNAQAINSDGVIVGFCHNGSAVDRATRWSSTSVDDLRSLISADQPSYASYAYGINKDGYIIGKARYNSGNNFHAYRCAPNGFINVNGTDLGTLGGNESIAYAINDSRQIVGTAQNSSGSWRAFIAAPDSTISSTGDLGSGAANAINNYGDVVGSGSWAFIWTSASGLVNLNNMIPSGSGWNSLTSAEAINDNGVIVGWGYKTVGQGYQIHGFRLTP